MTQDGGRRVIGLVGDVRHRGLEQKAGAEMYMPLRQSNNYGAVHLVVRTDLPEAGLASAVRAVLAPIDPNLPANEWRTLQHLVDKSISPRRVVVWLLAGFSGFALVLASLGIYAVIAYSVGQRTQEIGIRIALGASAGALQAGIILQTLKLAALGLLIGVAASWALGRMVSGLLFGVTATDPVTFRRCSACSRWWRRWPVTSLRGALHASIRSPRCARNSGDGRLAVLTLRLRWNPDVLAFGTPPRLQTGHGRVISLDRGRTNPSL